MYENTFFSQEDIRYVCNPPPPKISVIIPVYQVEPYLARCLDSVIGNTYRNLEIICVNDGSPDNCLSILRHYESLDPRIVVIDKENGGVSSARNAGMNIATGEYISFIDPDDWVHPQYFEILLHFQQLSHSDITICKHQETSDPVCPEYPSFDISSVQAAPLSIDALLQLRFARNYVWGRLYRASLLRTHRFLEGVIFEDTPFNLSLISGDPAIRITLISQPLYFYFMRPSSIVHTASRVQLLDVCQYYLRCMTPDSTDYQKRILMEECTKKLLTMRYEALIVKNTKIVTLCNQLLRRCLRIYLPIKSVSLKKKMQYLILACFPQIYRLYRVKNDPTLLRWEKKKKDEARSGI